MEVDRLLDGIVARRGDDQERRRRVLEQRADALGALREAVDHPAERAEEHRQVVQQVDAGHALAAARTRRRCRGRAPAAEPGRAQEHPDRAALEEARQPRRRVEEVERVARRRRVEHEQVEAALLVELVELRDRRELLRAGDRARELLVDPVGEHLVAGRASGASRSISSSNVRLASSIIAHSSPRSRRRAAKRSGSTSRGSLPSSSSPSEFASRLRGVDRDHRDPQPALGHPHRERGRGRRLADPAGPGADDDPAPLKQRRH